MHSLIFLILRWILARYDVDSWDMKQAVVDAPPNGVDIEFDYSRKEVEVCCECLHIFELL